MPGTTAGTDTRVFVIINNNMTAFSAVTVGPVDGNIIHDDATANAGAKSKQNHARQAFAAPCPKFPIGGRRGVVGIADRQLAMAAESIADWKVGPARKVGWIQQHARRNVLRTR